MQGVVDGRVTGGSAVAGLDEPTTGVTGTGTTWATADAMPREPNRTARSNTVLDAALNAEERFTEGS